MQNIKSKPKYGAPLYEKLVAEQQAWIESCGGTLYGYIAKYRKYGRTVASATAIYYADVDALERWQQRLKESK